MGARLLVAAIGKFASTFFPAESPAMPCNMDRPAAVGPIRDVALPCPWSVVYSYAPKMNHLFLTKGPPRVPPKRLLSKFGCPGIVPLAIAFLVRLSSEL